MASQGGLLKFFLAKGEKTLMFGSIGFAGLLLVLGIVAMMGAGDHDPKKHASKLDTLSQSMDRNLKDTTIPEAANAKQTDRLASLPAGFMPIDQAEIGDTAYTFERVVWPDRRRENPMALAPIDDQVDLVLGATIKMGREFASRKLGEPLPDDFLMLIRTKRDKGDPDAAQLKEWIREETKRQQGKKPMKPRQPTGGTMPGGGGGATGPGGPGGGLVGPGGPGGGFPGSGGGFPGSGGGFSGGGGLFAGGKTSEDVVRWVKYSDWVKKPEGVPAYLVYPTRMAVVHMSFPLQKQLEEIKKSLRLMNLRESVIEAGPEQMLAKDPETGKTIRYSEYVRLLGGSITGSGLTPLGGQGTGGVPGGIMPGGGLIPGGGTPGAVMPGGGLRPPFAGGVVPGGGGGGSDEGVPGIGGGVRPTGPLSVDAAMAAPVFAGFTVQRRVVFKDGRTSPWEEFDHLENYVEEFEAYEAKTVNEGGYMPAFLRPDLGQDMAYPLPELAPNWTVLPQGPLPPGVAGEKQDYPIKIRMPSIYADWKSLDGSKAKPVDLAKKYVDRIRGKRKPITQDEREAGTTGISEFGAGPLDPTDPTIDPNNKLPVKHMLIRFVDTKLDPGMTYQYRAKLRIRNPNFGKPDKMADENLAKEEFIESSYYELKHDLRVPSEDYYYAFSAAEYEKKVEAIVKPYQEAEREKNANAVAVSLLVKLLDLYEVKSGDARTGRKAVVQVQKWLPQVLLGDATEPVGGWVQAEIPVGVGEFIGKKVMLELPLWRSSLERHTLSPPPKPVIGSWPKSGSSLQQPYGRPIDFGTRHILLDFDGGKQQYRASAGAPLVTDESETEIVILRDDGKIEVRKEVDDAANKDRVQRETGWLNWIRGVVREGGTALNQPTTRPGRGGGDGDGGDR